MIKGAKKPDKAKKPGGKETRLALYIKWSKKHHARKRGQKNPVRQKKPGRKKTRFRLYQQITEYSVPFRSVN